MNRFVLFYSKMVLLLLSFGIAACSNSDKVEMDDYLTVGTDSVRFSADGGVFEMKVTASQDWTVSVPDEADEWCSCRKKVGSYLAIWTGKNTQEKEKIQELVLTSGNKTQTVRVFQQSGNPEQEEEEDGEVDDDPIEDVTKIFADELYTQLRPEVDDEMILRISTPWLRSLAYDLWSNKYPLAERVRLYQAFDDPGVIASKLKTAKYSRHDNPTGIAVAKGDELMVCVEDNFGQNIVLEVSDWEKEFNGKTYTLRKGMNKLLMQEKGLCYLRYLSRDYASCQPIKIHIIGGKVNGIFCTYATSTCAANTLDEWPAKLEQAGKASGFLDIVGRYTHWIAETQAYTRANTQPFLLMGAYDRIQRYEMELMGLFKYNRVPKNRMLFNAGPYKSPHASDYRTGYPKGDISYLRANADSILPDNGSAWGAAHEAGHVNQTRPGLKWIGMAEVTNNLHSRMVAAKFHGGSDKGWERCDYNSAVQTFYVKRANHNTGGYWNKLAPFWQLYLYTVEVLEGNSTQGQPYKDFYLDLHEQIRTTFTPSGVGPQVLNFAKKTCDVLELDITDYLQDIGFLREIDRTVADYSSAHMKITTEEIAEVKSYASKYPKGSSGIIYLTSQNFTRFRDLLKNDVKPSPAKVIVTGTTVSFSQWTNAVGFEVWKNGRAIAVSAIPKDSYIPQSVIPVPGVLNLDGCTFYGVAADGTRVAASGIQ